MLIIALEFTPKCIFPKQCLCCQLDSPALTESRYVSVSIVGVLFVYVLIYLDSFVSLLRLTLL